jgi:hypothetical protein
MKNQMTIEMVSFPFLRSPVFQTEKTKYVIEITNKTKSDLLVFPGYTLYSEMELQKFIQKVKNSKTLVYLEVGDGTPKPVTLYSLLYLNGKILKSNIIQYFKKSSEVDKNPTLIDEYGKILGEERIFDIHGKRITLILCGEINFLKNIQSDNNRVEIRTDNLITLKKFNDIISRTDIFINPQHSPMGNQGKMKKRREFLTQNNKIYCSTTNIDGNIPVEQIFDKLNGGSVQYCLQNGKPINGEVQMWSPIYVVKEYLV